MLGNIIFAVIGLAGGLIISAAVFALITSTGLMSRIASKSHTASYIRTYETSVVLGGILCNIFWIYEIYLNVNTSLATIIMIILGLTQGIYVGVLAVSLAEVLNATAIFARRAKLKKGFGLIICAVAFGKLAGGIFQFFK